MKMSALAASPATSLLRRSNVLAGRTVRPPVLVYFCDGSASRTSDFTPRVTNHRDQAAGLTALPPRPDSEEREWCQRARPRTWGGTHPVTSIGTS